jgi:hypothetical protein
MCKNQRDLRILRFVRVLCFEEGVEWAPVLSCDLVENSLRVSESDLGCLIRLTQKNHPGSGRNPYHKLEKSNYPPLLQKTQSQR